MKLFSLRRTAAVAKKEVFHVMRDPFTLGAALGLPVFMVVVFGLAIEFNVKNISLSVSDSDQTHSSRRLLDTFASSNYFRIKPAQTPAQAIEELTSENARATLIIPLGFEQDLYAGRSAKAQLLLDGSDSSTVQPVLGYMSSIQRIASERIAMFRPQPPYEIRTRYLFNPELNSRWFVIPALNVMVMGILSILLTALTVAREYENGSMELLLSTPIKPIEIIVGKLTPYAFLGLFSVLFIYLVARLAFGVPFEGSHWVFGIGTILFLTAYLCQGLLISVVTRNQQVAMQLAMISGMLPVQLFSGFVFPIESMPTFFQYLTALFPARWFMNISRETFLTSAGFLELSASFLGLTLFALAMITLGIKRFKKDLEA